MEDQAEESKSKAATGSVGFYDGQRGRILARDLVAPNGINISPDNRYDRQQTEQWGACRGSIYWCGRHQCWTPLTVISTPSPRFHFRYVYVAQYGLGLLTTFWRNDDNSLDKQEV